MACEHSWAICHGPELLTSRPECGRLGVKSRLASRKGSPKVPTNERLCAGEKKTVLRTDGELVRTLTTGAANLVPYSTCTYLKGG